MVVIIKVDDDNYGSKYCYLADGLDSAKEFICKDAECSIEELPDYEQQSISPNCKVYDFDDLIYRIHLKPENV